MAWQVFDGSLLFDIEPLDMGPEDDPICAWAETEAAKSIAVASEVPSCRLHGALPEFPGWHRLMADDIRAWAAARVTRLGYRERNE